MSQISNNLFILTFVDALFSSTQVESAQRIFSSKQMSIKFTPFRTGQHFQREEPFPHAVNFHYKVEPSFHFTWKFRDVRVRSPRYFVVTLNNINMLIGKQKLGHIHFIEVNSKDIYTKERFTLLYTHFSQTEL